MANENIKELNPIRQTSPEAILLAKTLLRTANFGALAVLEPQTHEPFVSRVAVATCVDGAPIILISSLSTHTQGLLSNPSCSLLLGEPGKGDPLAHPRITIQCEASFLRRGSEAEVRARQRYLRRNPKGKLYADFGDFSFVRLSPKTASLNGGFGQAFRLVGEEFLCNQNAGSLIEAAESDILEHMNSDHLAAVQAICVKHAPGGNRNWEMAGIDPDGADFKSGSQWLRVWFDLSAETVEDIRFKLIALASAARL